MISISPNAVSLTIGQTAQLTASTSGVSWGSSNPAIASVSGSGLVYAISPGSVTIRASKKNQKGSSSVVVQSTVVTPPPITTVSGRGPSPDIVPPLGATLIPAGSTTASRQSLIAANPTGVAFALASGLHSASGSNTPKAGQTFTGQYGAIIDGTGWASADLDDAIFRSVNNGIVGVTLRNLELRNGPCYGVNAYLTAATWVADHCAIHHFRNGISVGTAGIISNNLIHHNEGIRNDANPSLRGGGYTLNCSNGAHLLNNEIAYNGTEQKIIYGTTNELSENYRIADNFAHHNVADGLWIDGDGASSIIEGNTCEDNGRTGITVEIGNAVIVRNNTVRRSGAEGILISASRGCTIAGNTLVGNLFGIGLFLDFSRLTETYPFWTVDLTGNDIHGNAITVPGPAGSSFAALLTFVGVGDQSAYLSNAKANNFAGNTYLAPDITSNWFVWNGNKNFTQWQALPQDATGTIGVG